MPKFVIDGQQYDLVQSKFTFAEAAALEKVTGLSFEEVLATRTARVTQARLWVSMKRVNPSVTIVDLDNVAIDGIEWIDDAPAVEPGADAAPLAEAIDSADAPETSPTDV